MMLNSYDETEDDKVETYIQLSDIVDDFSEDGHCARDQTIIVKRMKIAFKNKKECQVLNFTNITAYRRLKHEEEKSKLLNRLNHSVHHELLGPLRSNVDIAEALVKKLKNQLQLQEMAKLIEISSKLIMFHANDMLDMQFLQNGRFTP